MGDEVTTGGTAESPKPQVSVIVPCFNSEDTVADTLDSLLDQTFQDWEAVVVNDASTDGSPGIVRAYATRDGRFKVLDHAANRGLAASRNTGIREAAGSYVLFLDADDLLTPGALSMMFGMARSRTECAGVYGNWLALHSEGATFAIDAADESRVTYEALCTSGQFPVMTAMVDAGVVREFGLEFDESMRRCEDWDFWIRLYRCGCRLAHLDECVAMYRENPDGLSYDHFLQWEAGTRVMDYAHGPDERCPRSLPQWRDGAGEGARRLAYDAWSLECLKRAIVRRDPDGACAIVNGLSERGLAVPTPERLADAVLYALERRPHGQYEINEEWAGYCATLDALRGTMRRLPGGRWYTGDVWARLMQRASWKIDGWSMFKQAMRHGMYHNVRNLYAGSLRVLERRRLRGPQREPETGASRGTVAIVYDWIPYPVRSGDNKRVAELIAVLRYERYRVHLVLSSPVTKVGRDLCLAEVDELHAFAPRGKGIIKVVAWHTLRFTDFCLTTVGLPRVRDIVSRVLGRKRHLAVNMVSGLPEFKPGLDEYLANLRRKWHWDAVIITFAWLHPAIDKLPPKTLRILDTIDLLHKRREQFESRGIKKPLSITRDQEADIFRKFDAVLAIQHEEAAEIRDMCPGHRVLTVGTSAVPTPKLRDQPVAGRLLYVGGANPANIDGLQRFLDQVWPAIRRACPVANLRVCGYIYQAFLSDVHAGVDFARHVDDIEKEYAAAEVVVNPTWIGTGLKIKTVEALARTKPLVSTPKGIEGMAGKPEDACSIAASDDDFSAAVVELLGSPERREDLRRRAADYADEYLSPNAVYREFLDFLEASVGRSAKAGRSA